jgi:hypothetical protein
VVAGAVAVPVVVGGVVDFERSELSVMVVV